MWGSKDDCPRGPAFISSSRILFNLKPYHYVVSCGASLYFFPPSFCFCRPQSLNTTFGLSLELKLKDSAGSITQNVRTVVKPNVRSIRRGWSDDDSEGGRTRIEPAAGRAAIIHKRHGHIGLTAGVICRCETEKAECIDSRLN